MTFEFFIAVISGVFVLVAAALLGQVLRRRGGLVSRRDMLAEERLDQYLHIMHTLEPAKQVLAFAEWERAVMHERGFKLSKCGTLERVDTNKQAAPNNVRVLSPNFKLKRVD